MGTITRGTKAGGGTGYNSGQTIDPAEVNTDLNTVYTEFNGNIANVNVLATAAIVPTKFLAIAAHVYNSASISISNNTETALTFDSERFDSDALHSTVTNTSRITIPTGMAGRYFIWGNVEWAFNSTGYRLVSIRLNGTTALSVVRVTAPSGTLVEQMNISSLYQLAAADYVEMTVIQTSGGALNAAAQPNYAPAFGLALLGT